MNTTPNDPTRESHEDIAPDASTTPIAPAPADDQPTARIPETGSPATDLAAPAPVYPSRTPRPRTPVLIAGGLGVAAIAAALGFGAGYITADTTSDRHDRVAVVRHGGDLGQLEGRGGPHGQFRGGPDGDGTPGPRGPRPGDRDSTDAPGGQTPSTPSAGQQPQPS
ncbi:hypothetical protein JTZ10_12650 [Gordonia rubripertincta]|uniref:Uncharacterized protein n=1 Tax=Gordonia rubripertincta TaxID=36822 RepID=A0AAW4G6E6_GORRU|nr:MULTISPECIES: hypothetical protein [Gordonia]MBM7278611.1 hypothetical protein [Gordonia rubripertincta]